MATATILKTRTKAPFAIVYVGDDPSIEGYAYTYERADKRARKMGRRFKVLPVEGGKVTVEP